MLKWTLIVINSKSLLFNNTPFLPKHKLTTILLYKIIVHLYVMNSCHFGPLKPLALRTYDAKLLDVLTSLPVRHALLPLAVCFAASRPAYHTACSVKSTMQTQNTQCQ